MKKEKKNGWYTLEKDGKVNELPAITTILGSAIPKPQLIHWAATQAARAVFQGADTEEEAVSAIYVAKNEGASRGSLVHSITEATDNGKAPDIDKLPPNIKPYIVAHQKFMADFKPKLLFNENIAVNFTYGYAGTLDRIYELNGKTVIVDYKTSKEYYKEMGLQLGAYKDCEFLYAKDTKDYVPMPKIDQCFVVLLKDDGTYAVVEAVGNLEVFLALKKVYMWLTQDKRKRVKIKRGGAKKNGRN